MNRVDNRRIMISTMEPKAGGVPSMVGFVIDELLSRDFVPVIAHYGFFSEYPALSVPFWKILHQKVGTKKGVSTSKNIESHAIGAWLPELEYTHYAPNKHWQNVMDSCRFHLSVSGSCHPTLPILSTKRPSLSWVATPLQADRVDRIRRMPLYRRAFDSIFVLPKMLKIERQILTSSRILALSEYTSQEFRRMTQGKDFPVMPMPICPISFCPAAEKVIEGKITFVGRIGDPRKNVELLLAASAIVHSQYPNLKIEMVGGEATPAMIKIVKETNMDSYIEFKPFAPRSDLPNVLQSCDLFVLPSYQEGLCISALEAMSCGCPIVSTRCGGPSEFIAHGRNGFLCDFSAIDMARNILAVLSDRALRSSMSIEARKTILDRYSQPYASNIFWEQFESVFEFSN
jgi:glycosyltransferase involved in cell wall biosynthesis